MNAGADASTGDVILFLHADVSLPREAPQHIERALADPSVVAGAFHTETVCDASTVRWAALLRLADVRSRWSRLPYGDQSLFVRRERFREAGGFPDQPLMEDIALSRRLRWLGRIAIVPVAVRVSGRRFIARPVASCIAMSLFPVLYAFGVSPHTLARYYGDPR
jgi:cellulose synthase/poly-beta-1,6-N-acetylglucosamine synthase-like glycosyltransferase